MNTGLKVTDAVENSALVILAICALGSLMLFADTIWELLQR